MLRPAEEEDFAPLTTLWDEGWHAGHMPGVPQELVAQRTPASFHERLRNFKDDLRVTGPVGAPTGFVAFKENRIDQFYVRLDQQGSGLATRLMRAAEAELGARGFARLRLDCADNNHRAIAFYTKAGWALTRREETAVDTLEGPFLLELLIFEKDL